MILIPRVKVEMGFQIHDPLRVNQLMYSAPHNSPKVKLFDESHLLHITADVVAIHFYHETHDLDFTR